MIRHRYISFVVTTAVVSAILALACLAGLLAIKERNWGTLPVIFMFGLPIALIIALLIGGVSGLIGWPIIRKVYDRATARGRSDVSAGIFAGYSVLAIATVMLAVFSMTTGGAGAFAIFGVLPAAVLTPIIIRTLWTSGSITEEQAP